MSFAELQDASGLAKSTTSRLLAALERPGLLERVDSGSYVAGPLFWLYAARHDPWDELVRLARPVMERIGADTGETVHLASPAATGSVQVAQIDSTYLLGTRDWTEIEVPAHCSALGKVLLACGALDLPRGRARAAHPGARCPMPTPYAATAGAVRDRGCAVTEDELEIGLTGIAVPVFGRRGDVVAALGVSGPTPRLADRRRRARPLLLDQADRAVQRCCAAQPRPATHRKRRGRVAA